MKARQCSRITAMSALAYSKNCSSVSAEASSSATGAVSVAVDGAVGAFTKISGSTCGAAAAAFTATGWTAAAGLAAGAAAGLAGLAAGAGAAVVISLINSRSEEKLASLFGKARVGLSSGFCGHSVRGALEKIMTGTFLNCASARM